MRFGMVAAAAAALACAGQADAARFYEFELKATARVDLPGQTFGAGQTYFYNSTLNFVFDTLAAGQAVPPPSSYSAVGADDSVFLSNMTNASVGNVADPASPFGPIFGFSFNFADVANSSALAPLAVSNRAFTYRVQVDPRTSFYIDGFGSIDSVTARTSDVAPAFTGLRTSLDITAVPEPATWGMMILGFGLVGGALRRRKGYKMAAA